MLIVYILGVLMLSVFFPWNLIVSCLLACVLVTFLWCDKLLHPVQFKEERVYFDLWFQKRYRLCWQGRLGSRSKIRQSTKLRKKKTKKWGRDLNKQTKPQSLSPRDILPLATLWSAKDSMTIPSSALDGGSHTQVWVYGAHFLFKPQ